MSQFAVYIVPHEFQSIKKLPGNVRQRIKRAIDELADNPRPPNSKRLDVGDVQAEPTQGISVRRDLSHRYEVNLLDLDIPGPGEGSDNVGNLVGLCPEHY